MFKDEVLFLILHASLRGLSYLVEKLNVKRRVDAIGLSGACTNQMLQKV